MKKERNETKKLGLVMPYKVKTYYLKERNFKGKIFNNPKKLNRLVNLAKTGRYSAPKLAKRFGCNKKAITYALYCNGISLNNLGKFKKRIYCNTKFFNKLNHVSAYWTGFIAADGNLYTRDKSLSIGLNNKDSGHIHKFKTAIKTNAKISYIKSNASVHINISSKELFDSLAALGITPNKSLKIRKVNIPSHLLSHFIRGVFDGDGTICGMDKSHLQFSIAGNKPFLQELQNTFIKLCDVNIVKLYPLKNKAYKLQYTGSQIFNILDFLYKDSNEKIRLDRKYKKYLELKKNFGP